MAYAEDILKQIAGGKIAPVYLLLGKERFFHDQIIHALSEAILSDPSSRSLNLYLLSGSENTLPEIVNAAQSQPMLSKQKLVVVRDFGRMRAADSEAFIAYVQNPQPYTVLVLSADELSSTTLNKTVQKSAIKVECKPLWENKVPGWIKQRASAKNIPLDGGAAAALAELTGNSLLTIENELDKLASFMAGASTITMDDVARLSGLSAEYNIFKLQNSLAARDIKKSYRIMKRLIESGDSIHMINAVIFSYFRKMLLIKMLQLKGKQSGDIKAELKMAERQFSELQRASAAFTLQQIAAIISTLQKLDKQLKSSNLKDEHAGQTLCYKICTA